MDEGGTCLRCGRPYEPGDTVCYRCGAPIGESQTPTQPVRAVRVAQGDVEGDSAGPAPAGVAATPPAPAPQTASPRARRKLLPWLALASLVILVALGGTAYAVRTLTAGPPVASRTVYQDPHHRFRFDRPALWTVTAVDNGVSLEDSSGTSSATVTLVAPQPGETAASYADALAQAPEMPPALSAAPAATIGGAVWEHRAGQVTGPDGVARRVDVFVTLHADTLYVIRFSSAAASYDADHTLVFQPLLDSFAFA